MPPWTGRTPVCHPGVGPDRQAGPGRSRAAARSPPAWQTWGGGRPVRPSIARPTPGTPPGRPGWRRCGAVPATPSTPRGRSGGRSPGPRPTERAAARSPPARRMTDTDPRSAPTRARPACHRSDGTTAIPPARTPRPRPRRPHCSCPRRSWPRTPARPHAVAAAAPANASAPGRSSSTSTPLFVPSSHPCLSGCCDDWLSPGSTRPLPSPSGWQPPAPHPASARSVTRWTTPWPRVTSGCSRPS